MLEKILIGATLGVIAVLVVIALQPADYRVTRAAVIDAPPAAVFARVTDLRQSGNKSIGEGRMTIVESRPHELVRMRLDFMRPFASTAFAEFTFAPDDGRTAVTWSMAGRNNFMAKAIHLIVNMDRMIGGQFEHGLAALKLQAEAKSAARL
jgi:hypothetical protein